MADTEKLTAKGQQIRATIRSIIAKQTQVMEELAKLERIAVLYEHGVDPTEIESVVPHWMSRNDYAAKVMLKSGEHKIVPASCFPTLLR